MSRRAVALALAVAFLGTGCFVGDDDCSSRIGVTWDFLRYDDQVVDCAGAGVVEVDTYVDGAYFATTACATGGTAARVAPGLHDVTVEGIDTAGRIAFRDAGTVSVGGCGTSALPLRPAEGTVNLDYDDPGCDSASCYLWFEVWDDVASEWAAVVANDSPASLKDDFPYPEDVVIRLPKGAFTLDWMALVDASYLGLAISCDPLTFDVAGGSETNLPVSLACPP